MFDRSVTARIAFIGLVIASGVQCGGGGGGGGNDDPIGPPGPAPTTVAVTTSTIPPARFIPVSTVVAVGGTVTWTNTSPAPVRHDLVATTSNWQLSRTLGPGESFQTTVTQAGIHQYRCTIHAGMTGTIDVR